MAATALNINKKKLTVNVGPATPLLWVLRDHLDLAGSKYGCGAASCIASCLSGVMRAAFSL